MLLEVFNSLHPAWSHLANSNDLLARIQLVQTLRKLRQRNQVSSDVGYLIFVLVAHIQQEQIFALIEALFQLFSLNLRNTHSDFSLLFGPKNKTHLPAVSGGGSY